MSSRILPALVAVGLLIGSAAGAQAAAPAAPAAASPRKLELAHRYMAAMHVDAMMGSMMNTLMPAVLSQLSKGKEAPPELKAALTAAASESAQAMVPNLIERMTPVVAETFTEQELQAAVAYYESPLGQSLLAKMPTYMSRMGPAMQAMMPLVAADMEQRFCRKYDCSKLSDAPKG